jgi:hypothetical protein
VGVSVTVVFLAYLPYGAEPVARFFRSYDRHPAGFEHELLVVTKGDGPLAVHTPKGVASVLQAPDDCRDLGTYLWTVRRTRADRYLFLNTSTIIYGDDWLLKLNSHLGGPVGIVGATGSYESRLHIRTTAFMLCRDLMLDLDWQEPIITKDDAYAVEHGPRNITQQILERGLNAVVVGRDGKGYSIPQWRDSDTYCTETQGNLLIGDTATHRFAAGSPCRRARRHRATWGFELGGV